MPSCRAAGGSLLRALAATIQLRFDRALISAERVVEASRASQVSDPTAQLAAVLSQIPAGV